MEKSVSNTTPRAILEACDESGINVSEFLSEIGLGEEIITNPNGRTSFKDVVRLWEKSFEKTGNRMIGTQAMSYLQFGAFKVIDYMMVSSPTPKEGLAKGLNYYPLINEGFDLSVNFNSRFGYVDICNPTDPQMLPFQYVDFVFGCVLTRVRFSTHINWKPLEVRLTCSEPEDTSVYFKIFQAPIKFEQPVNQMVFEKESLEILQPNSDPALCEMLDNHARHLLKQLPPEKDVLYELSRIMRKGLQDGKIDLNSSSKQLGMSRRSLQRKLKTKGISYRELLNKVRCEIATGLLKQKDISMEEVAFLVGYSEKSSFYRAFKNWTGKTPQDFSNH